MIDNFNINDFIYITNFLGVVAFSISGFFKAKKHRLDLFGALILGVITSVGGGITRDLLINRKPLIFTNHHDIYIASLVVIILSVFYKLKKIKIKNIEKYKNKMANFVMISDAIGLAIFTIIGCDVGFSMKMDTFNVVLLGTITAVGGGVYRDILVGEIPFILKEDIYAVLCIIGSLLFVFFTKYICFNNIISTLFVFFFILTIRLLVIIYKLHLPGIEN